MKNYPLWKSLLVILVIFTSFIFAIPSIIYSEEPSNWFLENKINLGLDLQGGSYLLLQVEFDVLIEEELENISDNVRQISRKEKINIVDIVSEDDEIKFRFANSLLISGLSWVTMTYAMSVGMNKRDKKKHLDKNLSLRKIGMAAYQRSTFSSITPSTMNVIGYATGATSVSNPIFNLQPRVRIPKSPIESNPSYDFVFQKAMPAGSDLLRFIATGGQATIDRQEMKRIFSVLPFQNALVISNFLKFLTQNLEAPGRKEHETWLEEFLDNYSQDNAFEKLSLDEMNQNWFEED